MTHYVALGRTRRVIRRLRFLVLAIAPFAVAGGQPGVLAQEQDKVIAVVNGSSITQKQVDASITAQLFPLQQQIYALRMAALENLILRTILEDEARKQGIAVEELRKQLTAGAVKISAAEVEQLYAEERLRLDLESRARMKNYRTALSALRSAAKVELSLDEPRLSISENDRAPSIGSPQAIVTIIEFSDFQCPYCRATQEVLKQIRKTYPAEVKLIFKHLPLEIHAEAFSSAEAAFCANEQGGFWKFHDALFTADDLSVQSLNRLAVEQGLDSAKFKACLVSETAKAAIQQDLREAKQLGINGTPTFIVNGAVVRGAISFEEFRAVIDRELKSAQKSSTHVSPR
jgi:protein-disulfide isomerase